MATYYNPKIITNNIEFSVDAANVKSWSGSTPIGTAYGYWACGVNRDPMPSTIAFSSTDRVDYSNDTATASPKGNASFATAALQAAGNTSYGYITGGYTDHPPASRQSSINRLDYSNDTVSLTVTGSTPSDVNPEGIYLGWGVGNNSYGYFGGNYPGSSRIFRLDYSSDTSAPLITGKYFNNAYGDAAGNQSYGWIAGKAPAGSRVERLDYSNDSADTVTKGPLTSNRYDGGAASNSSYGYFAGGKNGSPGYTTVDRIDFSNDTPTSVTKGPLSGSNSQLAATGDANYGYFGGGGPAFSAKSTVDRIDYSSDTSTAVAKGPLTVPRHAPTAFSSRANALPSSESIWKDMTGHGNLTVDGPTFSGLNGGVWDFDGTNDYMEKTSFSGVAFGTGDFAVETWVRVDNLTADHMIWETRSAASSTEDGLVFLAYGSNNDEWSVWTAGASKITGANSSVAADTWYHAIVTRISGTTTLYVNGVSIGSFSDSYNYTNDDLRIGKNVTSANWLNGKISLFRVYKARGFTASEVLNNFNATRTRFGV